MLAALSRLLLLIGLLAGLPASAAPQRVQQLWGWADDAGRASLADVLALAPQQWRALPAGRLVEQPQQAAYWSDLATQTCWLRLKLPRAGAASGPRWLELRPGVVSAATLHWRDAQGHWHGTDVRPGATAGPLQLPTRNLLLVLPAEAADDTLLLRLRSPTPFNLSLTVWSEHDYLADFTREALLFGLIYGVMLVMIVYNLVLDVAVRDPVYRVYSLNMLVSLVYQALIQGHAQLIWPLPEVELTPLTNALVALNCTTALMFANRFIDLRRWVPGAARGFSALIGVAALGSVGCLLAPAGPSFAVSMLLGGTTPMVILGTALWAWRAGSRTAGVFLIAWTLYLLGVIVWAARWLGLMEPSGWTDWPIAIGSALEAALLSLALAWRIRLLRRERKALQEAGEQYQRLMLQDELTGVLNRRGFGRQLESLLEQRRGVALVALDVDHFKQFNDAWGHPAGDAVLRKLGTLLKATIRTGDVAARIGGEEFVLLLAHARESEALIVAERLRRAFEATVFEPRAGTRVNCTLSMGIAVSRAGDTPAGLLERADALLYAAKRNGRNRVMSQHQSGEGTGPAPVPADA
ncbi:MAG: GGDEF domain-containing protein [Burkholderiales bacterium]|nr:GGDEF domain-containing protein [Burkholderiales bacterium]